MRNTVIDAGFVYIVHELQLFGFAEISTLVDSQTLDQMIAALKVSQQNTTSGCAGICNLLDIPCAAELASSGAVRMVAEAVLGSKCFAVGGTFSDEGPDGKGGWHQDTLIAVRERREAPGFDEWSEQSGIHYVRPPSEVLQRMISIRLNLNACGEKSGLFQMLSASHRQGVLTSEEIQKKAAMDEHFAITGPVVRGGMLAFKPLLIHTSTPVSPTAFPQTLQLDFAGDPLPHGMNWRWDVSPIQKPPKNCGSGVSEYY